MACMCELVTTCNDAVCKSLRGEDRDKVGVPFFARMFGLMLPPMVDDDVWAPARRIESTLPRASTSMCLWLIRHFPRCTAAAIDAAATGDVYRRRRLSVEEERCDASSRALGPIFEHVFLRLHASPDTDTDFRSHIARNLLVTLVSSASDNDDLRARLRNEMSRHASEKQLFELFDRDSRERILSEQFFTMSVHMSAEVAAHEASVCLHDGACTGRVALFNKLQLLEEKRDNLQSTVARLERDIQRQHRVACAMLPFVKIDDSLLVEESLGVLVKSGWESVRWKANYTLLHFAAECVDDPLILELVGSLASDMDQVDDIGMRAVDYLRERKRPDLEQAFKQAGGSLQEKMPVVPSGTGTNDNGLDDIVKRKLEQLENVDGLTPVLREQLRSVLTFGWSGLTWPSGFSPVHLAAQEGHMEALKLLADSRADLGAPCDLGLQPLDYAVSAYGNSAETIAAMQDLISQQTFKSRRFAACGSQFQAPEDEGKSGGPSRAVSGDFNDPRLDQLREEYEERKRRERCLTNSSLYSDCTSVADSEFGLSNDQLEQLNATYMDESGSASIEGHGVMWRRLTKTGGEFGITHVPSDKSRKDSITDVEFGLADEQLLKASDEAWKVNIHDCEHEPCANGVDAISERSSARKRTRAESDVAESVGRLPKKCTTVTSLTNALEEDRLARCFHHLRSCLPKVDSAGSSLREPDLLQILESLSQALKVSSDVCVSPSGVDRVGAMTRRGGKKVTWAQESAEGETVTPLESSLAAKRQNFRNSGRRSTAPAKVSPLAWTAPLSVVNEVEELETHSHNSKTATSSSAATPNSGVTGEPAGKSIGKGKAGPAPPPLAKGKGKKGSQQDKFVPRKAPIQPRIEMKGLWWTRLMMDGTQLKPGESIWDHVSDDSGIVPIDLLEQSFGRKRAIGHRVFSDRTQSAASNDCPRPPGSTHGRGKSAAAEDALRPAGPKVLRVIRDPSIMVGREAALRKLQSPHDMVRAIIDLDSHALSVDQLEVIQVNACPKPEQLQELIQLKNANPVMPLGLSEQYMWTVSNVPTFRARLDCWMFVRTYGEQRLQCMQFLRQFDAIISCFRTKSLQSLLGVVLAVGNYLNAGTARGQADGFQLDALVKIAELKDSKGKDKWCPCECCNRLSTCRACFW
eukprot:TRINITY_DN28138_c0_g1_i3.p1 TRINITY_DN28138_c0_g1~~TRINITY_DN28138_c0_g1_i3.p1  ORF type:complete len:1346 (-),score=177.93 TRINITY_DN28138_c0_g1_i3:86-3526(-)